jgi:hypothetical protein
MTEISRRNFIKNTSIVYTGITLGAPLLSSCSTTGESTSSSIVESNFVHYPRLSGQKIQSPEHYGLNGCMTAFFFGNINPKWGVQKYAPLLGKTPSVFIMGFYHGGSLDSALTYGPITDKFINKMENVAQMGIIPFITYALAGMALPNTVITGEYDDGIVTSAKRLRKFGEKYGGFFIRTMREMNLGRVSSWPPWGRSSKQFKNAWSYIWNIFEDVGTNEYATWVWNPYVGLIKRRSMIYNAEFYYPDNDKYVDWIGFNGYDFGGQAGHNSASFKNIFSAAYKSMRKNHPNKPLMVVDTATDEGGGKAKWISNAYKTLKTKFPGIKMSGWYHDYWSHNDIKKFDGRVDSSPESIAAFKAALSDSYFLERIPYRV